MTRYTIYKYMYTDDPIIMVKGAKLLTANMQKGHPYIWALVDTEQTEKEARRFLLLPTGHITVQPEPQEKLEYVGTCFQATDGHDYVWHIFEVVQGEDTVGGV